MSMEQAFDTDDRCPGCGMAWWLFPPTRIVKFDGKSKFVDSDQVRCVDASASMTDRNHYLYDKDGTDDGNSALCQEANAASTVASPPALEGAGHEKLRTVCSLHSRSDGRPILAHRGTRLLQVT